MRLSIKRTLLLVVAFQFLAATLLQHTTYANSFYSQNNIFFYEKNDSSVVCLSGNNNSGTRSSTTTIPSGFTLSPAILADLEPKIAANMPVYQQVSAETGIPADFFVFLHYRETNLSLNYPANGEGLYQDTGGGYPTSGTATQAQFLADTQKIATFLYGKIDFIMPKLKSLGYSITIDKTNKASVATAFADEVFMKALMFSYNGWAQAYTQQAIGLGFNNAPWEGSPYVMNLWDAARNGSQATDPNKWGQIITSGGKIEYPATNQIGAFTLYVALGGSASSTVCSPAGAGTQGGGLPAIVTIAEAELAKRPVEYDSNVLKYTNNNRYAWCAAFVSWVYREAGLAFTGGSAGGWLRPSVRDLQSYFKSGQDGWEYFEVGSKPPQPGDVAFYLGSQTPDGGSTSHVNLVISVDGDTMVTIGGNESDMLKKSTRKIQLGANSLVGFGRKTP